MKTRVLSKARAFLRGETGNVSIETALWVPLLLVILGSLYSLHHNWRANSLNTKAAYAIADALSRETDAIDGSYLDGMMGVMGFITGADPADLGLRVSLVRYDQDTKAHLVEWSKVRGGVTEISDMTGIAEKLPAMFDEERVILVETEIDYVPPIKVKGLSEASTLSTFGVTRPRFAPKIVWSDAGA